MEQGTAPFDPLSYRIPGGHKYRGMVLEEFMCEWRVKQVEQLKFEAGDIIVASYPKTGTTLTQEMVYLVRHGGDVAKAGKDDIITRVPFFESLAKDQTEFHDILGRMERPRTFKTHLNFETMENAVVAQQTRIVYVLRNPKDTLVSLFYFYKLNKGLGNFPGTWNEFFQMAMADFDHLLLGNMFDHFLGWWHQRNLPNVLITRFEDLVRNPMQEVARIADFCGKDGMSEEIVERITEATSFEVMKRNPQTNHQWNPDLDQRIGKFMRKGTIGDWKNHFTVAQNEVFEKMIREKLEGTGLDFCYE